MDDHAPFRFKFRVQNLTPVAEDELSESSEMYFSQHLGVDFIICFEPGEDAMMSARRAISKLRNHYVQVDRLEPDLVTRTEIAERADVRRQTVSLWVNGQRKEGFPLPAVSFGGGLWYWPEVENWLTSNDSTILVEDRHPSMAEIDTINGYLNHRTALPDWSNTPERINTLGHISGVATVRSLVEDRMADYFNHRTSQPKDWSSSHRRVQTGKSSTSNTRTRAST